MSKKSTARTGSEGDADSTAFSDVFANIRSDSSSRQSKRELEGGPFGDSPCENTQQLFKDCFILMFRDEDTSTTEASEGSDIDQELYSLQNDYLDKLNVVRRTLNLLEIEDEDGRLTPTRCTITEIVDDETSSEYSTKNDREDELTTTERRDNSDEESCSNTNELVTILPPVQCYNFDPSSIFEVDYNPPKKKLCHRQKTPRPTSLSEGNLPYYTRVALHDDLFNPSKDLKDISNPKDNKSFVKTKETQCTDEDFKVKANPKDEIFIFGRPNNVNLFPEVVIGYKTENACESSSSSSMASIESKSTKKKTKVPTDPQQASMGLSLNIVNDISDDSFTTTTYSTTIDSPEPNKMVKKRFGRRHRVSSTEKLTLWEEIRKLHSSRNSTGDLVTIEDTKPEMEQVPDRDVKPKKGNGVYIKQYLRYKRQIDKPKSRNIPFGTTMTDRHAGFQGAAEYFRPSDNSSDSTEDKKASEESGIGIRAKFLVRTCFCCWPEHD